MTKILNNISLKAKLLTLFLVPFFAFILVSAFFIFQYFHSDSQISSSEFTLTSVFIILVTVITIVIYFFIAKDILFSLSKIKDGLDRFFNYLTSTEKNLDKIDLDSKDDFGVMAKNLNESITKIKDGLAVDNEVINEAKFVSKMIGKGFLVYRINSNANNVYINELRDSINHMIDNLRINIVNSFQTSLSYSDGNFKIKSDKTDVGAIVNTLLRCLNMIGTNVSEFLALINKNGIVLDDKAKELLTIVNELHNATLSQASSLEQTTAAISEITDNISQTTSKANKMLEIANMTKDYTHQGISLVEKTQKSMYEINESTKAINDAISLIDQIAFQTNILSLNAAVEAATAGEAGKGFAVVAAEVRNLANRSAQAASEIKKLVENANAKSDDGKVYSNEMKESFEKLASMIEENTIIITDVANSNETQKLNLSQINEAMYRLDSITQENANMATKTKELASQTNEVAHEMLKAASLNEFDIETQKSINNFDFTQEINRLKIDYVKYKQAILNQVNSKSNGINVELEYKQNIENFINRYKNQGFINHSILDSISTNTKEFISLIEKYGLSMKDKNEKDIYKYSDLVEHKLDEISVQLNQLKVV